MRNGAFVVTFHGKKQCHEYICITQDAVSADEIEAMAFKCCCDSRSTSKTNDSDLSIIKTLLYINFQFHLCYM
jgi:hypothetical protein